jgi:hypothetical protein
LLSRALYRISQFRRSLNPRVSPSERDAAHRCLGDELFALFELMHPADQRHALDVFELLLNDGHSEPHILQAALIHDCGKASAEVRLWHRVAWVIVSPVPLARDAVARTNSGLRSLAEHGPRTVALARAHGAAEEVVMLLEELDGLRELSMTGLILKRADDSR